MDANDYPEEQELERIRKWDITKESVHKLVEYVIERWKWAKNDYARNYSTQKRIKIKLATGGWSGNEDIISALADNVLFWAIYWQRSERGGHYWFDHEIP